MSAQPVDFLEYPGTAIRGGVGRALTAADPRFIPAESVPVRDVGTDRRRAGVACLPRPRAGGSDLGQPPLTVDPTDDHVDPPADPDDLPVEEPVGAGPPGLPASARNSQRTERIHHLLDRLAQATDPGERRRLQGQLVVDHISVAKAIAARYRGRGVEREDLEQLACLGLIKAAARWLPGRSDDFLQFAVPTIAGEIKRYFRDHTWLVRPSRRIQELRAAISQAERDSTQGQAGIPTDTEIGERIGATAADVREARAAAGLCRPPSLDAPTGPGLAISTRWGTDDAALQSVEDRMSLGILLANLSDREREVVRLRYELGLSQLRIGQAIGVSQMQVSRILRTITEKLREHWQG